MGNSKSHQISNIRAHDLQKHIPDNDLELLSSPIKKIFELSKVVGVSPNSLSVGEIRPMALNDGKPFFYVCPGQRTSPEPFYFRLFSLASDFSAKTPGAILKVLGLL